MAGKCKGVGPRIERMYPRTARFWCANHQLNLVIVAGCKEVLGIHNMMATADEVRLSHLLSLGMVPKLIRTITLCQYQISSDMSLSIQI